MLYEWVEFYWHFSSNIHIFIYFLYWSNRIIKEAIAGQEGWHCCTTFKLSQMTPEPVWRPVEVPLLHLVPSLLMHQGKQWTRTPMFVPLATWEIQMEFQETGFSLGKTLAILAFWRGNWWMIPILAFGYSGVWEVSIIK